MTTRNLDALFKPRTVALIGASNRPGSVGAVVARNLLDGGFDGDLYLVNLHEAEIAGRRAFASIASLPRAPDLAIIATPAAGVAALIAELGAMGCRAAVVISAGDTTFRSDVLAAAQPHLLRIVGPNCLGFLSPIAGLNASFAQLTPRRGKLALVTQSGAIATSVLDWAEGRGIGFSHLLSLGDMADVDFGDVLDFLALDTSTSSILLYVEQITNARKFMSAARIAARSKPVIVVKAGRSPAGAKAAASHTGALAGADGVYDAAFRRAGMLRVDTLRDLFDAAETLNAGVRVGGDRLLILTNGGGLGVLAADALASGGGELASLSATARTRLDSVLPPQWSRSNPVDIIGDANGARYGAALDVLTSEAGADAILVMNCPTGVADNAECAAATAKARAAAPQKPMLTCWTGGASLASSARTFAEAKIPTFDAPEDAIQAFLHLSKYGANQRALLETPVAEAARDNHAVAAAAKLFDDVLREGRTLLSEAEAKRALALYGVSVVPTGVAHTPAEAHEAAACIGGRVALKILSRDITHKSDVGGVALGLNPDNIARAATDMLERVKRNAPGARIDGFTVQAMAERPHAQELIVGASVDPTFGPIILFGQGGTAVEVVADSAIALPPLNSVLAQELIARTRVAKLLAGFRDHKPANLKAVADALVAISHLVIDHPCIAELDINPLLTDAAGAIALDARIVLTTDKQRVPPAIAPYPQELSHTARLVDDTMVEIRPLRPADAGGLLAMAARTTSSDLRLRFHGTVRSDDALGAARLCQLDYDREMAFVAVLPDGAFAGVARAMFDPEIKTAEFAVLIRSDLHRQGIGKALMHDLISYVQSRGGEKLYGDILAENAAMLTFARALGAQVSPPAHGMARATFNLASAR